VVVLHFHATEELRPLNILRDCECATPVDRKVIEPALNRIDAVVKVERLVPKPLT
jgi:hypothetical protein